MPLGPRPSASSGQALRGDDVVLLGPGRGRRDDVALRVVSAVGDGVGFPAGDGGVTEGSGLTGWFDRLGTG